MFTLSDRLPSATSTHEDVEPDWYWDARTGRYHWKDSKNFAPLRAVNAARDRVIDSKRDQLASITEKYIQSKVTLPQWRRDFARTIKMAHTQAYLAGRGGVEHFPKSEWPKLEAEIEYHLEHLDQFRRDIRSGRSNAQIRYRASLYVDAINSTIWMGKEAAAKAAGKTKEKNVMNPQLENCPDCLFYTGLGVVAVGTIPVPGKGRVCMVHCGCKKVYL